MIDGARSVVCAVPNKGGVVCVSLVPIQVMG
jgi:hypothetical protein